MHPARCMAQSRQILSVKNSMSTQVGLRKIIMPMVKCENCGELYDNAQGEVCPRCGACQPMALDIDASNPTRDTVICENCGKNYNRDQGETCPNCGETQPMETNINATPRSVDTVSCENCGGRYVRTPEGKCPYCGANEPLEQGLR